MSSRDAALTGGGAGRSLVMESPPGPRTMISGKRYLYFGGVGYYGLHDNEELMEAGVRAWRELGSGSATSRAGMGTTPVLLEVEETAARFFGTAGAAYLASGYLSNTAGVQALQALGVFDVIFMDEHAHYCVGDAARSTGLPVHRFGHLDPEDLAGRLAERIRPGQRPLVMTDGLFPVFGRIAPVPDYLDVLEPYDGAVWLDDAHPGGILGPHGRGTADHHGLATDRVYWGGTLSKAFGGFGGVIPGPATFVDEVRGGPVMIAASAPPSPLAAASLRGLQLVMSNPHWREELWRNARLLKDGLRALGLEVDRTEVPIAAFALESEERMREVHARLLDRGIAIQHTYYSGAGAEGVLRVVVFSSHSADQIDRLIDELARLL